MEYLGVGALVFLLVLLPLLLAIVIVTAIAGGFLRKTNEFRSRQEKSEELPAVVPTMTNAQIQQSLNQLNDRVQVVEQSVSQIELQLGKEPGLFFEKSSLTAFAIDLADSTSQAKVSQVQVTEAARESEPNWARDIRRLLASTGKSYSELPIETDSPNKRTTSRRQRNRLAV